MAIKTYKPITPGLRFKTTLKFDHLDVKSPEKALTKGAGSHGGRDTNGRISVRRRGGGSKRKYRTIDFVRAKVGVPGVVTAIEYDPNRSANIALITYADGEKRYILAPKGLTRGEKIENGPAAELKVGNSLPLENIPVGSIVHAIELQLGKGAQLARSAGASATIVAAEGDYVTVRLPSGEMRLIFRKCRATLGSVGNEDHMNVTLGKAGRARWMGRRPEVRGVAMNPVDHPHGGGEGSTAGGRHPVSPWGTPTKGYKTRKKRKSSGKFIVKKRK